MSDATCAHCGAMFTAKRSTAKYCGGACREAARRSRVSVTPTVAYISNRSSTSFAASIEQHHTLLRKRTRTTGNDALRMAADSFKAPPTGQAAFWYDDAAQACVHSRCARAVALAIAKACGNDSQTVTSQRSLADALCDNPHKRGQREAVRLGLRVLVRNGWLTAEPIDGKRTRYSLQAGEVTGLDVWAWAREVDVLSDIEETVANRTRRGGMRARRRAASKAA